MDSLLANYASSDEEEDEQQHRKPPIDSRSTSLQSPVRNPKTSPLFSSLPKPQSSSSPSPASFFSSLPPPKSAAPPPQPSSVHASSISNFGAHHRRSEEEDEKEDTQLPKQSTSAPKISNLFSSLPQPKSVSQSDAIAKSSGAEFKDTKRVVQFRPPVAQSSSKFDDDDDDDDEEEERERKKRRENSQDTTTVRSFLSTIPAPKNSGTLGAISSLGSGRRLVIEDDVPSSKVDGNRVETELAVDSSVGNGEGNLIHGSNSYGFGAVEGQLGSVVGSDPSNLVQMDHSYPGYEGYSNDANSVGYGSYGNDANYGDYVNSGNHGYYEGNWDNESSGLMLSGTLGAAESVLKVSGRKGKNQVPTEIIEVKQDELIKNRPREDQVKLTGIAFGPNYQSAAPSKFKPTKLHKRKHQIGSLFFDMKQKEMELAERRSRGLLTKAETQAKYGW